MKWKGKLAASLLAATALVIGVWAESPIEREQQPKGYIALTFDDGPSGALTEQLLDGLRIRNARATFFLCGYRMDQYPSVLNRYLEEGHELGVHSTVHTDLTKLTPREVQQDMAQTAGKIRDLTGISPLVMRPPGGAYDETVCREADAEGMSVILWSVDPRDWASHDVGAVLHTMAGKAGDGDVILMHDLSKSSIEAALRLVDMLEERGYCFVTVSELAALRGVILEPGNVYTDFPEK